MKQRSRRCYLGRSSVTAAAPGAELHLSLPPGTVQLCYIVTSTPHLVPLSVPPDAVALLSLPPGAEAPLWLPPGAVAPLCLPPEAVVPPGLPPGAVVPLFLPSGSGVVFATPRCSQGAIVTRRRRIMAIVTPAATVSVLLAGRAVVPLQFVSVAPPRGSLASSLTTTRLMAHRSMLYEMGPLRCRRYETDGRNNERHCRPARRRSHKRPLLPLTQTRPYLHRYFICGGDAALWETLTSASQGTTAASSDREVIYGTHSFCHFCCRARGYMAREMAACML